MAHRLVAGDRPPELPALLRVRPRVLHRGGGDAERHRRDLELLDVERRAGEHAPALVPSRLAADDVLDRHLDVLEDDVGRLGIAQPEVVDRGDGDAGRARRHKVQARSQARSFSRGVSAAAKRRSVSRSWVTWAGSSAKSMRGT
jgi:hypothetical protein